MQKYSRFAVQQVKCIMFKMGRMIRTLFKSIKAVLFWPYVCSNWDIGIKSYLRKLRYDYPVIYKLRNGLDIYATGDWGDFQIIREIYVHKTYTKLIDLSNIRSVIDAGAHKGFSALQFSGLTPATSKIICLEPDPRNYSYLRKNIMSNHLDNRIKTEELALYSHAGDFNLYTIPYSPGTSFLLDLQKGKKKKITVRSTTLGDIIKKYKLNQVDLLKMDIEGAEYDVLYNLGDELQKIKRIIVECHEFGDNTTKDMIDFLESNGYHCALPYSIDTVVVGIRENI